MLVLDGCAQNEGMSLEVLEPTVHLTVIVGPVAKYGYGIGGTAAIGSKLRDGVGVLATELPLVLSPSL